MLLEYNKSAINLREGKIFIDGVEVFDGVACTVNVTPQTAQYTQLGDITPSTKFMGATITGSITRRRATPWLKDIIKDYFRTKRTPELTIQGVMNDRNSDYFADNGSDTTTLVGVVLTGDLPLTRLDGTGTGYVDDVINFTAKNIV